MSGRRFALAVLVAALLSLTVPAKASADARYERSTPGKGEVVTASPARMEITFTQAIQNAAGSYAMDVAKDRGQSVTAGASVVDESDRKTLSVPLQPNLQAGRYVVTFKTVSGDDGHAVNGAFAFYVNKQPNAIDLDNDRQLESAGAESGTPPVAGTGTAAPGSPVAGKTPPSGATLAAGSATARAAGSRTTATSTAIPPTASADGGGGNSTLIIVIVAVAGAAAGAGAWLALARRNK